MKKKLLFQFVAMLLAMIVVTSCQKQILEQDQSDEVFLKSSSMGNVENKYRLLVDSGLSDGFLLKYHYNNKGLADKFHVSKPESTESLGYEYWATMEYNNKNLISKAKFYWSEEDFYDLVFVYRDKQLIKETWYYPGTLDIYDDYINIYNKRGQLVKRDNPPWELYSIFHYDAKGNCKLNEIFDYEGNLAWAEEFEYSRPIKNPFASVTGLPISMLWVNDVKSPDRPTGFKVYYLDGDGNQVVNFHWQSADTEIRTGRHHYPVYQNSRDVVSGTWTDQVWKYENHAGKKELYENHQKVASIRPKANPDAPSQFKFRSKTFKQDMKAMRLKHGNEKNAVAK